MNSVDIAKADMFVHNLFDIAWVRSLLDRQAFYVEFRLIKNSNVKRRFYHEINEIDWQEIANDNSNGYNIFFGVCGRSSESGKVEAVCSVPSLWLDIDNVDDRKMNEICSIWYEKYELPIPSYVIKSGHGLHIYWLLKKPSQIKVQKDVEYIRGYLKGLADFLGADCCHDLARVMRLPETINWKYPDAPVGCNIWYDHWENCDIVRYPLSIFDSFRIEIKSATTNCVAFKGDALSRVDIASLRVSERIKTLILNPPQEGERSEAVFAVVRSMKKAGYTPDEVLSILMNNPIGDRYEQ